MATHYQHGVELKYTVVVNDRYNPITCISLDF